MDPEKQPEKPQNKGKIVEREIETEMKESYLDYSMSVLVGRALPDVRDGLKPVHRRILYAMNDMSLFHNKPYKKCARIVGEVLGKYHPHGDQAVFDALVRMAQDFSLRYPLVQGQGNFGSIDGDNAAAMRYVEARLAKPAEEILQDIDKETVDFVPNFDGSLKEPLVLPSKLPNLLVNGSSGIAVGMATNIPPHNFTEVADGILASIENQDMTVEELMQFIPGPDFPTGAIICGDTGILEAYSTGRGIIKVRAKTSIEQKKDRERIIVSEIPFQVNKSMLVQEIAALVNDKRVRGISDLRDESDKDGIRIVIELKKDANSQIVLNQLFTHSKLETTFGVNTVALVNGTPKTLDLLQLVRCFIDHRKETVTKRTQFELRKAEDRTHILEGLIAALESIDETIKSIKESQDAAEAKKKLIILLSISEKQAQAILDMRLQRLASLEQKKIRDEHIDLIKLIAKLKEILGSDQKILGIIKDELTELKKVYGDKRRTEIQDVEGTRSTEDLIKPEDMVITVTHSGYIKRLPINTYRQQHRGGRGITGVNAKENDFVERLFIANTHSYLLFFTDKGKVYWLKVYEIPEASRQAAGKAIANLLNLQDERITAFVPVKKFDDKHFLVMATKQGVIKKTNLEAYSKPRKAGIIAVTLDKGDSLVSVELTNGEQQLILATRNGGAVRFKETDIRAVGRSARGVRGIRLKPEDSVIGMVKADDTKQLLTITAHGYGKRTPVTDYRLISRGGSGVINLKITEKTGRAAIISSVTDSDQIMVISKKGIAIRIAAKDVSLISRNTQGVRVMRVEQGDNVVSAAKVVKENHEGNSNNPPGN